jgi:hypothetical protein
VAVSTVNVIEKTSATTVNVIEKTNSIAVELVDKTSPVSVDVVVSGGIINYAQGAAGADGADGADGNGINSVTDNQDGTFTFNFTDSTVFTTPDLTGPQGETGATGSVGSINTASDVSVSNPADGDILEYNSTSSVWQNKKVTHKHYQNNSSTTWDITHNLGLQNYLPNITVKLTEGAVYNNVQATGIVTYVNENRLTINFLEVKSGYAYIKK